MLGIGDVLDFAALNHSQRSNHPRSGTRSLHTCALPLSAVWKRLKGSIDTTTGYEMLRILKTPYDYPFADGEDIWDIYPPGSEDDESNDDDGGGESARGPAGETQRCA